MSANPFNLTGYWVNASHYPSLHEADIDAEALSAGLNIDRDVTLSANLELRASQITFTNAKITRGTHTLIIRGRIIANEYQNLFDAAGTGLITPWLNTNLSVYWFGALGLSTDDTTAFKQTILSANAAVIHQNNIASINTGSLVLCRNGIFKITDTITVSQNYTTLMGSGTRSTVLWHKPTTNGTCLKVEQSGAQALDIAIRDLSVYSDDVTYVKTAINVIDFSSGLLENIWISGEGPNSTYHDTTNSSVGIQTNGRDNSVVNFLNCFADKPIRINANPNASADSNEDQDHWTWSNLLLQANQNPHVVVETGHGASHLKFTDNQAWIFGTGGFVMNDTRTGVGLIPSRNIHLENIRTEQASATAGYAVDVAFSLLAGENCFTFKVSNSLFSNDMNGIKFRGVQNFTIEDTIFAQGAGKTSLNAVCSNTTNMISIVGSLFNSGATVTTTGYATSNVDAYNMSSFSGPANAVYVARPAVGIPLDFRYSGQTQNDVTTLRWAVDVAAGATQILSTNTSTQNIVSFIASCSGVGATLLDSGFISGNGSSSSLVVGTTNFDGQDTASKLCFYIDVSFNLKIKNNTAEAMKCVVVADARF